MRAIVIMFILGGLIMSTTCVAQQQHNPKDQIQSLNWNVIGSVKFGLDAQNRPAPIYSGLIYRFQNTTFELTGYLIPVKSKRLHDRFLLSPLPINQCFFCGQNGVPSMILVVMKKAIPYSEKPITVSGILKLAAREGDSPITLAEARLEETR